MISSYYRNITWIAISRETFLELKKLLDEKGYVSYDELIKELLKVMKR
jgi:predicted CopG family antitoxin